MVEFAFVMTLLFVLIFGIITFGYMMSFRGSMAQSASEGARAAATAPRPLGDPALWPNGYNNSTAQTRAQQAIAQAVGGFDRTCGAGGLTCDWDIHDCADTTAPLDDTTATPDCMTVELIYDYDDNPLLPEFPLLSAFIPNELDAKSVVELNQ